jgi:Uma2 family endonuclease
MSMPTLKRQWTVADLQDLPDDGNRYEVIDGELLVTPSPSWPHQTAVVKLYSLLDGYVTAHELGYVFVAPADVVFSPRRGVQPDLFVVPPVGGRRPTSFEQVKRLMLAVEILSPSTARADRVKKRFLYRDEAVPEYWIVDLDARTIERSTPTEQRPEVLSERLTWMPDSAAAPLEIDLVAYFERVLDG